MTPQQITALVNVRYELQRLLDLPRWSDAIAGKAYALAERLDFGCGVGGFTDHIRVRAAQAAVCNAMVADPGPAGMVCRLLMPQRAAMVRAEVNGHRHSAAAPSPKNAPRGGGSISGG